MMSDGLQPRHRESIIHTLAANPRVERVVLFGSRATGAFTTASDVDIALFGESLSLDDQAELAETIAESAIPQRMDILIVHQIENQKLLDHIRKYGVEWFNRNNASNEGVHGYRANQ